MRNVEMVFHSMTGVTRSYHVIPMGQPDAPIGVIQRSGGDPYTKVGSPPADWNKARPWPYRWRFYPLSGHSSRKDFDNPEDCLATRRLRLVGVLEANDPSFRVDGGREAALPQLGDRELGELEGKFVALDQVFAELRALRALVEQRQARPDIHLPMGKPMSGGATQAAKLQERMIKKIHQIEQTHAGRVKTDEYWLLRDAVEVHAALIIEMIDLVTFLQWLRAWIVSLGHIDKETDADNIDMIERIDEWLADYVQAKTENLE